MKYVNFVIVIVLVLWFIGAGCKPPEIEGTIVHMQAKRMQDAYDLALVAVEKYPTVSEAWYLLGKLQGERGEIKEMSESYNKSLAIDAMFESEIKAEKAFYYSKYFNMGVTKYYNEFLKLPDDQVGSEEAIGYLDSSLVCFEKARYIKNDYSTNRLIAMSYMYKNDTTQALNNLLSALEVQPDTVQAYIDLGQFYQTSKNFTKAIEYLEKGKELSPDNAYCTITLATMYDFTNEREKAIATYKEAMEINPEEKAIPFNLGLLYYKIASDYEENDPKWKEALENAAKYLLETYELDAEIEDLYNLIGPVLINLGRYDEAIELLQEGTDYFDESCIIWTNLSVAFARAGRDEEARETYAKVKEMGCD